MMLDTSKPNAMAPLYVTYTANAENEITAIRADREKNVYIAGMASPAGYPHESVLRIAGATSAPGKRVSFVSVLNSSGSRLLWSTLLPDAKLTALALDEAGSVFVTGRIASPQPPSGRKRVPSKREVNARYTSGMLIAGIAAKGQRLSYAARLGSNKEEGRAISITSDGRWLLIAGATDSPDGPAPVAIAIQPCKTGAVYSRSFARSEAATEIAVAPALDAFAADFPPPLMQAKSAISRTLARVQIAPACVAEAR
jgi:hypothetical protein